MEQKKIELTYKVFPSIDELPEEQQMLLNKAKEVTNSAYAPYSNFHVGAAAKLSNGQIVTGTNQENASFSVGLCAERVLLSSVSSLHPNTAIDSIAISYQGKNGKSDHPVAPCGVCRQTLQEYEDRIKHPIQIILGGATGEVYVIDKASSLLPFAFRSEELK